MLGLLEGFGIGRGLTWMGVFDRPVVIRADIAAAYDDDIFTLLSMGFHTARLCLVVYRFRRTFETVGNRRFYR